MASPVFAAIYNVFDAQGVRAPGELWAGCAQLVEIYTLWGERDNSLSIQTLP